jgi:hypothetical protein
MVACHVRAKEEGVECFLLLSGSTTSTLARRNTVRTVCVGVVKDSNFSADGRVPNLLVPRDLGVRANGDPGLNGPFADI